MNGQSTSGQDAAPPASALNALPPKASIEGRVVQAENGQPLKKVWIVLRKMQGKGGTPYGAVTDAEGRFAIREIEAGRYSMSATRNGYVPQQYGQKSPGPGQMGSVLTFNAGQEMKDILFRMVRGGTISGRVVDEDGEPLARVQVQALRYVWIEGERKFAPMNNASTNDLGEFRIFGLPPQQYLISATLRNGYFDFGMVGPGVPSPDESYAPVYYPGTNDPAHAILMAVKSGEELHADMTLLPVKTFRVRGKAMDAATGQPASHGAVMLWPRNFQMMQPQQSRIDNDGKFELRGISSGSYVLHSFVGGADGSPSASQEIDVSDSDLDGIVLTLTPGKEMDGTLRVKGGSGVKAADLSVYLQPLHSVGYNNSSSRVKADGSFTLKNITDQEYLLRVSPITGDSYLQSARVGERDILTMGLNGGIKGTITVEVANDGGKMDGQVMNHDQQPAVGATVVLLPETPNRFLPERYKLVTTDQYGRFQIRGIRPERYKLYAWEQVDFGSFEDPEFMKKFEDQGKSVRVSEGAQQKVDLKLIEADSADK